jgi:hypothetical protein
VGPPSVGDRSLPAGPAARGAEVQLGGLRHAGGAAGGRQDHGSGAGYVLRCAGGAWACVFSVFFGRVAPARVPLERGACADLGPAPPRVASLVRACVTGTRHHRPAAAAPLRLITRLSAQRSVAARGLPHLQALDAAADRDAAADAREPGGGGGRAGRRDRTALGARRAAAGAVSVGGGGCARPWIMGSPALLGGLGRSHTAAARRHSSCGGACRTAPALAPCQPPDACMHALTPVWVGRCSASTRLSHPSRQQSRQSEAALSEAGAAARAAVAERQRRAAVSERRAAWHWACRPAAVPCQPTARPY